MRTVIPLTALAFALGAAAQPTINAGGIVNGASFAQMGLPNANIARGSIFSIFGANLGPASSPAITWPLLTNLGGVKVHILPAGAANPIDAILLFVRSDQINAVLPSAVPAGPAAVTVEYPAGQVSNAQAITVVTSSPGLFAVNSGGSGPAALQNHISSTVTPLNAFNEAAHPGQTVIAWGTGLGPVSFDETQPNPVTDLRTASNVQVFVGGKGPIAPDFAGRSGFSGEDQVNFVLPADVPTGCRVPVMVKANGIVGNTVTLAISPGTNLTCSDDLTVLPSNFNQDLRLGTIALSSTATNLGGGATPLTTDFASASFLKYAAADVLKLHGSLGVSAYGACSVYTFSASSTFPEVAPSTGLDAGTQLNLAGPNGLTRTLVQNTKGSYSLQAGGFGVPAAFLVPGLYTVDNGAGGPDVARFSVSVTVPPLLSWTNMAAVTAVSRSTALQVAWTGGDEQTPDAVIVLG